MARLKAEHKQFIVTRLACFDTPSEVSQAVKDEYGLEMTRQRIQQYDPTKAAGQQLSKKLSDLFHEVRERFVEDTGSIAISHKAVRLARLDRMATRAETKGNLPLAASLLEQAAKEAGDWFTNLRKVAPTDPKGENEASGVLILPTTAKDEAEWLQQYAQGSEPGQGSTE